MTTQEWKKRIWEKLEKINNPKLLERIYNYVKYWFIHG